MRVEGSGLRVQGLGFRVKGSGFRVQDSGFRVQGSGFRVYDFGETKICLGGKRPPRTRFSTTRLPSDPARNQGGGLSGISYKDFQFMTFWQESSLNSMIFTNNIKTIV